MTKDTCIQHFYKKKKTPQYLTIHTRLLQNPWGLSYGKQENTLTLVIPHAHLQTWKDLGCKSNSHLQGQVVWVGVQQRPLWEGVIEGVSPWQVSLVCWGGGQMQREKKGEKKGEPSLRQERRFLLSENKGEAKTERAGGV